MANANLAREETTRNMDTPVDIEGLVISMKEKLDNLSTLSPKSIICRVPTRLRQLNERAYTPVKVSIGPLHHGKDDLKPMEEYKWRYLKDFLERSQKSLEYLVKFIKKREESIRERYEETIRFDSDKFVKIILVDAAFIIEVLLKVGNFDPITLGDPMFGKFGKSSMFLDVYQDFLVLENQLPFFVLNELLEMIFPDKNESTPTFIHLACKFLRWFNRKMDLIPDDIDSIRAEHFVDLQRCVLKPTKTPQPDSGKTGFVKSPTVTELHNAGIKFKLSSSKNLFDIRFTSGVLEIPKFEIYYGTEVWLRNLLAFEGCLDDEYWYMTDYVCFLDHLIDSSTDVGYLVKSGVIVNSIGNNNDALNLINKLSLETWSSTGDYYFSKLCEELNGYCKKPWHQWKATLRRDYCKTPWRIISIIAAFILLSLTLIQTVFSIVSVGK